MIKNLMHSRISKILIVGFIVMGVTGCSVDHSDHITIKVSTSEIRREKLLKESLKEMQETNAMLQQILQKLEVGENEDI